MVSSDQDEHWMRIALGLAKQAYKAGEVPVGAIIVREGEVIGEGFNRPITSHDPSAHAEIEALRDAGQRQGNYRLPGSTMYVTIEPCTMCLGALVHARVTRLVYGAPEPKSGAVSSRLKIINHEAFNHQILYTQGVMQEECATLISEFFAERRKLKKAGRKQGA